LLCTMTPDIRSLPLHTLVEFNAPFSSFSTNSTFAMVCFGKERRCISQYAGKPTAVATEAHDQDGAVLRVS